MPRGVKGAASAKGMVLAGVDSMGGEGEPYPTLVHFWVWLGAALGRAVPRLLSAVWVARPDPWFTPCPLLFRGAGAPSQKSLNSMIQKQREQCEQ